MDWVMTQQVLKNERSRDGSSDSRCGRSDHIAISFANATVVVEQLSETEIRIRKSIVGVEDAWLPELEERRLSDAARDRFLEALANPPAE